MATLEQVMTALRNADAAGDVQGARRLAQIAQQMRSQQAPQQAPQAAPQAPPEDTSMGSAFMQGLDAPLEGIGTTLDLFGLPGGETMRGLTQAPENYKPTDVVGEGGTWYKPWTYENPGDIPRAAMEGLGSTLGSAASRTAGAAVGSVAGPAGAAVGALAGPALFEFTSQLGNIAQERAKNQGREEPNADDVMWAMGTAGAQGALNALPFADRLKLPEVTDSIVKSVLSRFGNRVARTAAEGATETAQSAIQQTGETLGTEAGFNVDMKQAVNEGIAGGAARGLMETPGVARDSTRVLGAGVGAAVSAPIERVRAKRALEQAQQDPEQFAAELDAQRLVEAERQAVGQREDGSVTDEMLMRGAKDRAKEALKSALEAAKNSADISREQYKALAERSDSIWNQATNSQRGLSIEDLSQIDELDVPQDVKEPLKRLFRVADVLSTQGKSKNSRGPMEVLGRRLGSSVGAKAGGAAAGATLGTVFSSPGLGTALGAASGAALAEPALGALGRGVDAALRIQKPELLRRANARQKVAQRLGIDLSNSLQDVNAYTEEARQRSQGLTTISAAQFRNMARQKAQREAAAAKRALEKAQKDTERQAKDLQKRAEKLAEQQRKAAAKADMARLQADYEAAQKADREAALMAKAQNQVFRTLQDLQGRRSQIEENAKAQAEKTSQAAQRAYEKEQAAQGITKPGNTVGQQMAALNRQDGVPIFGGWMQKSIKDIRDHFNLEVTPDDFKAVLDVYQKAGIVKPEEVDRLFNVGGKRPIRDDTAFYEIQNRVVERALARSGVSLTQDQVLNWKQNQREDAQVRKIIEQAATSQRVKKRVKEERAKSNPTSDAPKRTRERTSPQSQRPKPRATPRPKPKPESGPEAGSGVRNPQAYQGAINNRAADTAEVEKRLPDYLKGAGREIANAVDRAKKRAVLERLLKEHPDMGQKAKKDLERLVSYGKEDPS